MSYLHETELEIWAGFGPANFYESFCNFAKGQTISKANSTSKIIFLIEEYKNGRLNLVICQVVSLLKIQ